MDQPFPTISSASAAAGDETGPRKADIWDIALGVLAILAIVSEVQRTWPGDWLWDFGSFLESGRAAARGLNPYGIYPLTFHVRLPGFEAWNPNLNPPISALLFQAFDLADPPRMFRIWYGISAGLYAVAVLLLLRRYRGVPRLVLALWAIALAGFWDTLLLGQVYVPLALAAICAWLLLDRGATLWAGALIGIVIAIKPNFAVWPVLLLLSGHFRPAIASFVVAALISLVPVLVLGPEVYRQWIELVASDAERAFFLTNASLSGLAARAGVPLLGVAVSLLLLAASALWAIAGRRGALDVSAVGLIVALLASPIAWVHYTLFILPIFFWAWRLDGIRLVAALLIVPVSYVVSHFGSPPWQQVTTGSVYNWALVLLLAVILVDQWRRSGAPSFRNAWWRPGNPALQG